VKYKDGRVQKRELYYGASFLSQSGRFLTADQNIASIEITDNTGKKRVVSL
jgi:hypothetical protein